MDQNELINIFNQASRVELTKLPRVGSALAEKIIIGRPFTSLDDVRSIKGIGEYQINQILASPNFFSNTEAAQIGISGVNQNILSGSIPKDEGMPKEIKNGLAEELSDIKEAIDDKSQVIRENMNEGLAKLGEKTKDIRENLGESLTDFGETLSEKKQEIKETFSALPGNFEKSTKSRGLFWTIMMSSAITAFITIVLLLLILLVINGSLKYATGTQYNTLVRQTTLLQEQTTELQTDLGTIRSRLVSLEGFGERTVALEKAQQQLFVDVEEAKQMVDSMQDNVTSLSKQVSGQEQRTLRFETFLKDLQNLLGGLFAAQGEIQ